MENEFKKELKWDTFSQKDAEELLLNTFESEVSHTNRFNSEEARKYFRMFISTIMIEYDKYFHDYGIEIYYRSKSLKSIIDKVLDYMSREDASVLKYNQATNNYDFFVKNITDGFAFKIVMKNRPSTFHANNKEMQSLIDEKIKNQEFLGRMQEFKNKLIDDEFSIKPNYLYNVTKRDYYNNCKELIQRILTTISPKATKLISHYHDLEESVDETLKIIYDIGEESDMIDKDDYPSDKLDFSKLLQEFSARIYDKLDLEVLTRQMTSLFKNSQLLDKLHVVHTKSKPKTAASGYVSNFIFLNTPFGEIECQLQSEHEYWENNFGYSAHSRMDKKKVQRYKIPDSKNKKQISTFRDFMHYVSPKSYHVTFDNVEKNKVLIQGYSDYKNYRNLVGQVPEGSQQEKALIKYFEKMYRVRDDIFESLGQTHEITPYDINKYLDSEDFKQILKDDTKNNINHTKGDVDSEPSL